MSDADFEIVGLTGLRDALVKADKDLTEQINLWLEGIGFEFLKVIQDEIIRSKTVDTRRLLNSFDKSGSDSVWKYSNGGLTLEIGTNVEYAKLVNEGHWTVGDEKFSFVMKDGTKARWVPGDWKGHRFEYNPASKKGMLLKRKWVDGSNYFDTAFKVFEKIFQTSFERRLQGWLDDIAKEAGEGK